MLVDSTWRKYSQKPDESAMPTMASLPMVGFPSMIESERSDVIGASPSSRPARIMTNTSASLPRRRSGMSEDFASVAASGWRSWTGTRAVDMTVLPFVLDRRQRTSAGCIRGRRAGRSSACPYFRA